MPLGAVLPRSVVTPPLTIPAAEAGRGQPSPEPAAAPRGFGKPCCRLSRRRGPARGTARLATAWQQVALPSPPPRGQVTQLGTALPHNVPRDCRS